MSDTMKKQKSGGFFSRMSGTMLATLGTLVTVILGATMRGDWIIILVHISKQFGWDMSPLTGRSEKADAPLVSKNLSDNMVDSSPISHLAGVHWFVLLSLIVSFISYHSMGGFLHYYFYVRRRDEAKEWKCQPDKFLTPENERHEILLGSFNMALGGTASGVIACHIINGGYTTMYFSPLEMGLPYLIFSTLAYFLITDYLAYIMHRLSHLPLIYKTIHKLHHRYHQPTAWSATAMHPAEFCLYQGMLALPAFIFPIYSASFIGVLLYQYYYGMMDHSGIKMTAVWPWQPPSIFHDNHHKYFHTNFGFNLLLWDWLHDTLRKDNRVYGESIFYGRGKAKPQ